MAGLAGHFTLLGHFALGICFGHRFCTVFSRGGEDYVSTPELMWGLFCEKQQHPLDCDFVLGYDGCLPTFDRELLWPTEDALVTILCSECREMSEYAQHEAANRARAGVTPACTRLQIYLASAACERVAGFKKQCTSSRGVRLRGIYGAACWKKGRG
jgi:hypothetical protein